MKTTLSLVVVILLITVNVCWAGTNRSTLWLMADEQIYSSNDGYQACGRLATAAATWFDLATSAYFDIEAQDVGIFPTVGGDETASTSIYVLSTVKFTFSYSDGGTTDDLTYTLAAFSSAATLATEMSNLPLGTTISSATGNTWLSFETLAYSTAGDVTAGTQGISWQSAMITDYRSNTTIVVTGWQDGVDAAAANTNEYNHFYMITLRTTTSLLTASTDKLVGGCTSRTRRKRSVAEGRFEPRGGSSCSTSNAWDSSLQDDDLDTACSTARTSSTYLGNAVAVGVSSLNSVRSVDDTLFGAGESKFKMAANFGVLVAFSTFIFSLLN